MLRSIRRDASGLSTLRQFRRDPIGLLEEAATYGEVSYLRLPRFPVSLEGCRNPRIAPQ